MRTIINLLITFLISVVTCAQPPMPIPVPAFTVTTEKTTSLIFSTAIRHINIGNAGVAVQQVGDAQNILHVKAAVSNFKATNLNVVTADGLLHSFEVSYAESPAQMVYDFSGRRGCGEILFTGELMNQSELQDHAKSLLDNPPFLHRVLDRSQKMVLRLTGIYLQGDIMFCQFVLDNPTTIDYDIDYMRFYIRDKNKGKRTASQENEVTPLLRTGNCDKVSYYQKNTIVVALEKFTIPDGKFFCVEIGEKNGGRNLRLTIRNHKLLKAKVLPTYQ